MDDRSRERSARTRRTSRKPLQNLPGIRRVEEEIANLLEVGEGLLDRFSLARDIEFRAESDIRLVWWSRS